MSDWVGTGTMADVLGIHRKTLGRLKSRGYFMEGQHFRKANPLAPKSKLLWHKTRVLLKMDAD